MRKQNGFTLIEILVTVVVTAIGLLGLAGLQATALKFNSTSYQRSQAVILAYDMIERIRANPEPLTYLTCNLNPGSSGCTGIAQQDIQDWRNALAATLPSGVANLIAAGNAVTVRIQWDDSRGQAPPQEFSIRTDL